MLLLLVCCICQVAAIQQGYDQQIKDYIMKDYQRTAFPVNSPESVILQLSLAIQGLEKVDRIKQLIVLKIVLRYKWNDSRLRWDPQQFGGVMNVTTSMEYWGKSIWYPDTTIWESSGKLCFEGLDKSLIHIFHNGGIYWSRPGSISILHKFSFDSFPFGKQKIMLQMHNWIHPSDRIYIIPWIKQEGKSRTAFDIEGQLQEHMEYNLQLKGYKTRVFKFINGNYSYIDFYLEIEKNPQMIFKMVIIPSFMIQGLGLMVFSISPDSPLRVVFSQNILLATIMFQFMINNFIPDGSEESFIQNLMSQFIIIQFALVSYTLLYRMYFQKYHTIQKSATNVVRTKYQRKFIKVYEMIFDKLYGDDKAGLRNSADYNLDRHKQQYAQEYKMIKGNSRILLNYKVFHPKYLNRIFCVGFLSFKLLLIMGTLKQIMENHKPHH